MLGLDGRRILVSGGGRGIGRATARLLGRAGARLALGYVRDKAAAETACSEAAAAGGSAIALQADLARPEEAARLVEAAADALGGLDGVVVNHGIWKPAPIETMSLDEWRETLAVNLDGAWALAARAARRMAGAGGGALVLIASTAGQRGEARFSHYAATKGAILALTKSLAAELAPRGIRVNAVAPGWVLSDMTRHVFEGPGASEAVRPIPLGRPGRPEEVAGPVAFLLSDLSAYLYGEVLDVNGGSVMSG